MFWALAGFVVGVVTGAVIIAVALIFLTHSN